jgi:hypothetical protein
MTRFAGMTPFAGMTRFAGMMSFAGMMPLIKYHQGQVLHWTLGIALRLVSTIQGLILISRGLPLWARDEFGEAWRGSI